MAMYGLKDEDEEYLGDSNNYKKMLMDQLRQQQEQSLAPSNDSAGNNQLVASLNQSLSKLGSIGGKVADTSDVSRYAQVLDQAKAAQQQQQMAQTGQQSKILEQLAMLKDKDQQKKDSLAFNNQKLEQSKAQKMADQDFELKKQDRSFGQQKELQGMKQSAAQDIAQVKAEQKPSKAAEAVDREFGKDYNDFVVKGGYGDAQKGIQQLNAVANSLATDSSLTGPIAGRTPDFIRSFTNPKAVDTREQVQDVVQRSLKAVLGAQFTEKEGERVLARAYNPTLDAETNRKRILGLANSLKIAAESKLNAAKYYEANGTMQGFKGTVANSVDDILSDLDKGPGGQMAKTEAPTDGVKAMGVGGQPQGTEPSKGPASNPAALNAQASGTKKIVGGKTYVKAQDGLWYPE